MLGFLHLAKGLMKRSLSSTTPKTSLVDLVTDWHGKAQRHVIAIQMVDLVKDWHGGAMTSGRLLNFIRPHQRLHWWILLRIGMVGL